jgi:hypothetical protein
MLSIRSFLTIVLCSKSSVAAGAPIAGIRSQAKISKDLRTKTNLFLKNEYAPCRVAMCDQCNEIINRATRETIPLNVF